MESLPTEILLRVFFFLNLHDRVQASQVCTRFRIITSDPILFPDIDLRRFAVPWTPRLLSQHTKSITLRGITDGMLKAIGHRCVNLEKLEALHCRCMLFLQYR